MTSVYRRSKLAAAIVLLIVAIGGWLAYRSAPVSWWTRITATARADAASVGSPELAAGEQNALTLPADVSKRMAVRSEPVQASTAPVALDLSGSLIIDSDLLAHVHARFPGEIVALGPGGGPSKAIGFGQRVCKGQLLAVIWSQDLGEKKSELIDALSQLRVDDDALARISAAAAEGAVPERVLRDSERKVEADRIAVSRAERTLQSWRISKEEIDQVRAEAKRLSGNKTHDREEMVAQWAKLEVRAPLDGTIIERNVTLGELVDTSTDLFKIADLTRLGVLAYAYEEDLPKLDALPPNQRAWSVTVGSGGDAATRIGRFEQVGCIIDPNQHTALVMGWVDNPDGKLRVGQFVKTRLEIPPPSGEVVVPASALGEEGDHTFVLVQSSGQTTYARRGVAVVRRSGDKVYVRSQPTAAEQHRGAEPLAAGEQVVVSRVVQLSACLDTLQQNDDSNQEPHQAAHQDARQRNLEGPMINRLIRWAVHNRLVVISLAAGLMAYGIYAFREVNVEAYPDPAPAIVEVVARYTGASAEEVERQVTMPLEVALAGMPGLKITRTQSLFELCHVSCQFEYGVDPAQARQEVLNRLQQASLPTGVSPEISPRSPTGEIYRYVLVGPKDAAGRDIYDPNDLKSLQDNTLEKLFRRLPRIADVSSYGGTVKRYEIHPDPARMQRYGVTLQNLKDAISSNNSNVGGDYIIQGGTAHVVRALGLLGRGQDPMEKAMGMKDPVAARDYMRAEEQRRIREIRQIVLNATNNVPVCVDDVVEGGPLRGSSLPSTQGVVMGYQTRLGHVMRSTPVHDAQGRDVLDNQGRRVWRDEDEVVEGIVVLRKGDQSLPALDDIHDLVKQLNENPGRLLPGVKIVPYYDRTELIGITTSTVQENLLAGMGLVTVVLLLFLSNVRTALIVAINLPLALLFALAVLFVRGKSANLLSIGAVDFGIIVDSSVIMVENIFRHLSSGVDADQPINRRILRASDEVQKSLAYSTAIMVCAFLPLFTMAGPEGQIFGPMADTYAFALAGALLLALVLSPVLCAILLPKLAPRTDNWLVRTIQTIYRKQLERCLQHRGLTLVLFGAFVAFTAALVPMLGREFLPELEEGNMWIAGTFPMKSSLDEVCEGVKMMRRIVQRYPECDEIITEVGRSDDGTDPSGFYGTENYVPLKPHDQWPIPPGWSRPRTKEELVDALNREISETLVATDWNFSQNIRNNVNETLSGVRGDNSVKIIGPDLVELENTADRVVRALQKIPGLKNVGAFHILGQSNLNLSVDRDKCARWNLNVGDVQGVVDTAVGGKAFSQMIEGERSFDITLRYPRALRSNLDAILDIPVEVSKNTVVNSQNNGQSDTPVSGPTNGPSPTGTNAAQPPLTGSSSNAPMNDLSRTPRRRLRDLLTPLNADGQYDEHGSFLQRGASDIYRENGERMIVVKFDIDNRDLAGAVADAKEATKGLVHAPCRLAWAGEFQAMEKAEARLRVAIPLAVALVAGLLYMAFGSLIDVLIVLANVVALGCGGVWALYLTQTNFSVSAAVGFISIFGVAIMDGLLLVSSFHRLRLQGKSMHEAIVEGSMLRTRSIMMTGFTAIFGLLPAALSTRIGAQSQRPLAIVVIGGMLMALFLLRYLTPVLYSLFRRQPPNPGGAGLVD